MNTIDILIRAIWQGARATQQARKDLEQIDDGAKKGGGGLADFAKKATAVTLALGTVTLTAKKAYEALERGAGLELTQQRFDRLAKTIGTTGDALRDELGVATAGLLSTSQQMALVTDLIGLGLVETEDQAVRLARVVSELNQDVGELSLALVNQTTRRFDQLGVSAVGFEERLKALEAQGLSTQAAFTEAFLQQAEAQIDKVGGKAGTAAGDLQKIEAAFLNIRDAADKALLSIATTLGAFDDVDSAADGLNNLAIVIETVGDNFDKVIRTTEFISTLINPVSLLTDKINSLAGAGLEYLGTLEKSISHTEGYKRVIELLADAAQELNDIFDFLPEIEVDMAAAVAEAESFDRALMNANNTLIETVNLLGKVADIGIADRGGFERGGGQGGRGGELIRFQPATITEQIELFTQFQEDLTAVTKRAQEERAAIEEQYESERTATIEAYNRQRAQEEADWLRRRQRQDQQLQKSIDETRSNAVAAEQDARERANDQLAKLERDHLRRMQEIIENADLARKDAASRLDAGAIASINRQEELAKRREIQSFQDQRQEIERSLQQQLDAIRDNMAERINDLQEFHDQRQAEEEEDRAVRLQRLEEAHNRELQEIDAQYRQRMQDLKASIRQERLEIERRYIEERLALTQHWNDKIELEAQWQQAILEQEAEWWRQRSALVGGGGTTGGGAAAGAGAGAAAGGGGELPPTRNELFDMVRQFSAAANYSPAFIDNLLDAMKGWTDRQIALWLERAFGIDVPGYLMGTSFVPRTGLAFLHEGERVMTAAENRQYTANRQNSVTINVHPSPGMDEATLARHVRREFAGILEQMA